MRFWFGALAALLMITGQAQAGSFDGPSCAAHKGMTAVDMSQPTNTISPASGQSGYVALKAIGVKTIIRYYDWVNEEDISCKALLPSESDAIIAAGLNIISVFQHKNDDPESFFIKDRGATDARHALNLAHANGQPSGSAIYFSVDGVDQTIRDMVFEHGMSNGHAMTKKRRHHLIHADRNFMRHIRRYGRFLQYNNRVFGKPVETIRASDMNPAILRYFDQVKAIVKPEGYKIGAYGSGAVCELLLGKKLVDYCWLAQSTGRPGFDHFYHSKRWTMVQEKTTVCRNWKFENGDHVWLDFNRVNSTKGAWGKKDGITALAAMEVPKSCN
ncbi:MAG: glycoside hydrolase domain-containing protein [Aestuariivirga sp.]